MRKIRVLGVQIQPELGNKKANIEKVGMIVESYADYKPDLIVMPEVFTSGVDHRYLQKSAEAVPEGETTEFFTKLAKKYSANIVSGSFIEKEENGEFKNTSLLIGREGEILGKYQKIHMFNYYGSNEGDYVSCGEKAVVAETDIGKIGLSVCYDLRFPELYRAMAYAGAEIITCVAAWPYPRYDHWITLNKARAVENTVYMLSVNQTGRVNPKRQNIGASMLVNPWGEVVSSAGSEEGGFIGEIDFDLLAKIRQEFPVLNDRNLKAYSL